MKIMTQDISLSTFATITSPTIMSLFNKKCDIGGQTCDLWIVKVDNDQFMYGGQAVANILGYKKPRNAIRNHVKPNWKKTWEEIHDTANKIELPHNWQSNKVFINEIGVYSLILRSKLPSAELFRQWLFEEVLPGLRKTTDIAKTFEDYTSDKICAPVLTYVYIATSEEYMKKNIYKIGTTRYLTSRLNQLNCGRAYDLLYYIYTAPVGSDGLSVEKKLHDTFVALKLKGEFYQLQNKDLLLCINIINLHINFNCSSSIENKNAIATILKTVDGQLERPAPI
ncbi:BRO-B [Spodoptera eridania nucleopolyhedrovirus]|uniref:BRO-B n=1 Tax=Spodoptera eridania nucleopolyhedrovirus TaxID=2315721 RepID=A0A346TQ82_9ABAC|nr:BRO-B [Spodoptera eridania nucleopolyhedrovirus]AXU41742.1 BRO-B [Spodoptera eridania nucleopolyhedrovirus]